MRNMSFALTTEQVRQQTKTVTRRLGWKDLQPGDLIQPVVKCQGLKKGERVEKIGGPIRVVTVWREPLHALTVQSLGYALTNETAREGFPQMTTAEFVAMFCQANKCRPNDMVTRIQFEYAEASR